MEKMLSTEEIYNGKVVKLYKDSVLLENGNTSIREIVKHSGGSGVLVVENNKVLLVRQYRYAYGEYIYEIPAGKLVEGEDPLKAAVRELEEECGIIAKEIVKTHQVYPTPGYTTEILHLYRVDSYIDGKMNLDEDEFLEPIWVDLEKAKEMLKSGQIKDAKTIIALQQYFLDKFEGE